MSVDMQSALDAQTVTREQVEDFLYAEAELLDNWRLDDWLELLAEDIEYVVPNCDLPDGDPATALVIIVDDIVRLRARVARLNSRLGHREFPHSRTRRLISNVRIVERGEGTLRVEANYLVARLRSGQQHFYTGRYRYLLRVEPEGFKISRRRAELDLESLDPHGTVSIIL